MDVKAGDIQERRLKRSNQRRFGLAGGQREAELAVAQSGRGLGMGLCIDAGRDPQHDPLLGRAGLCQFVKGREFIVVVDDDPSDAAFERVLELVSGFAVAVEGDVFRIHAARERHVQFTRRDHIEAETLLHQNCGQRRIEPGFAGVMGSRPRNLGLEVAQIIAASLADRVLVVDVERGAEIAGEIANVATAELQRTILACRRAERHHVAERVDRCLMSHGAACALATLRTLSECV